MCGAWIALEDGQPRSGELEVVPGGHRFPWVLMGDVNYRKMQDDDWSQFNRTVVSRWQEMIAAHDRASVSYEAKAGSLPVWHENLMHGGKCESSSTFRVAPWCSLSSLTARSRTTIPPEWPAT